MNDIYRALNRVGLDALTGQQKYFVQVASDAHHQRLSVVSFEALERIGEPYRITVQLTYEQALARADYLDGMQRSPWMRGKGLCRASMPVALRSSLKPRVHRTSTRTSLSSRRMPPS